jgi:hypothetical protein
MLNAVEGGRFIDPIGGIIADSAEQVKPLDAATAGRWLPRWR